MRPSPLDIPTMFLTGTAGSGKSTLTGALIEEAQRLEHGTIAINLDPGADTLPYEADVDIRHWLTTQEVMDEHGLGPNGAQVAAADIAALHLDVILEALEPFAAEMAFVDTPGQLELYAFRASGPHFTSGLTSKPVVGFMMDPSVVSTARGYAAQLMLGATVAFRLGVPIVNVLSKIDSLDESVQDLVMGWSENPETLEDAFMEGEANMEHQLLQQTTRALRDLWGISPMVATSAVTKEGLDRLIGIALEVTGAE